MFANILNDLINEKNITQKQLSDETKIPKTSINNWVNGRVEPNSKQLITLANYFCRSIDYLLGRENDYGLIEVKGYQLQDHEKTLLDYWKKLTEDNQIRALGYMTKLLHQQ